jgi:hypothetical protein
LLFSTAYVSFYLLEESPDQLSLCDLQGKRNLFLVEWSPEFSVLKDWRKCAVEKEDGRKKEFPFSQGPVNRIGERRRDPW